MKRVIIGPSLWVHTGYGVPTVYPQRSNGDAMPESREMPARKVRVPDHIWDEAAFRAELRGDNLSAVLRRALVDYKQARAGEPAYVPGQVALFGKGEQS